VRTIDELLTEVPALRGMADEHLRLIAGCARNEVFEAGRELMREGEEATSFYVIRSGRVALETFVPQRGALTIETLEAGALLGWSWLVPPHRTSFDARAVERVHAISFDGGCLRGKCEEDPVLGFELMQRFVPVIVERLQATRVRLLDVYGPVATS
jgi:CRP/FNR family transcriptional regulator, cyclic AMP receptor protein